MALARACYGPKGQRGREPRSWLDKGQMHPSQAFRLGREDKPDCFASEEQWLTWCMLEAKVPIDGPAGYCHDCTLAHQCTMKAMGRCDYPDATFSLNANGALVVRREGFVHANP